MDKKIMTVVVGGRRGVGGKIMTVIVGGGEGGGDHKINS